MSVWSRYRPRAAIRKTETVSVDCKISGPVGDHIVQRHPQPVSLAAPVGNEISSMQGDGHSLMAPAIPTPVSVCSDTCAATLAMPPRKVRIHAFTQNAMVIRTGTAPNPQSCLPAVGSSSQLIRSTGRNGITHSWSHYPGHV